MAQRYSNIMQAARLKTALDNYTKYISGQADRQVNIGSGKNRQPTTVLYVKPFGTNIAASQFAQVSGNKIFWDANKSNFNDYTQDELKTGGTPPEASLKMKGFRPARFTYRSGIATDGKVQTSNVTKLKYLSYGGTSTSAPFGNKATPITESAAFAAIKTKFGAAINNSTTRAYWSREKY